ncbi:hypothetical protein CTI12_AA564400 [Artemisia annua]|uniref:Uncharacterized protein n=1 Tax=Artemisia annua TaxID=35608 RepID=A0A2U1KTP5_ARTAN|nr:hypothetical protein CTI12_AA564400 [Artemisia annua]
MGKFVVFTEDFTILSILKLSVFVIVENEQVYAHITLLPHQDVSTQSEAAIPDLPVPEPPCCNACSFYKTPTACDTSAPGGLRKHTQLSVLTTTHLAITAGSLFNVIYRPRFEVLKKDPPEWEKKELENYIAKDIYKGNASGPTKKAVKKVIKRAEKNAQRAPDVPQSLSPPPATDARRKSELISKVIMKKCHSILCHVPAKDTKKVLSDLVGRKFNSEYKDLRRCVLKPVIILPTNVGSRIWFCVHEVLKKDPPEWEKNELENYIAKDVYKGNASGPTKVKFHYTVSLHCCFLHLLLSKDTKKVLSDLVGRKFNSEYKDLRVIFQSESTRPLDLLTIESRFLHGTYGDSHKRGPECWRKFLDCDGFLGRRNPGSSRRTQGENFPLFEKVLTATDTGKSRWLVLPKNCAELLPMPNAADTPAGEGAFGSKRKQPKRHHLNAIIAREISMPRIPVGTDDGSKNATLPSTRKRKDGTYIDSQTKQKAVCLSQVGQVLWWVRPVERMVWLFKRMWLTLIDQVLMARLVVLGQVSQHLWRVRLVGCDQVEPHGPHS